LFWAATAGAVISLGIAWHELPRLRAGVTGPAEDLLFLAAVAILAGTLLIAGRIMFVLSGAANPDNRQIRPKPGRPA